MIHCTFERIGRHHDLTLDVDCEPEDRAFFDAVDRFVRKHVASLGVGVWIYADNDIPPMTHGTISIEGGRFGSGTWATEIASVRFDHYWWWSCGFGRGRLCV